MRDLALLIRKDFLCAASASGNFPLVAVIWMAAVAFAPGMAPMMFVMLIYIMVISLFSSEENDLVCNITAILPVSRELPVIARYVYAYLGHVVIFGVSCLLCGLTASLRGAQQDWLPAIMAAAAVSLLMVSLIIPVIYKMGVVKMRTFMMIIYIVMVMLAAGSVPVLREFSPVVLSGVIPLLLAGSFVLSLLSLFASLRIVAR